MTRTPQQVEADTNLRNAIEQANAAYMNVEGVITDYLVLFAEQAFDDQGEGTTKIGAIVCDPPPPAYRQIGLLHTILGRLQQWDLHTTDDT